MTIQPFENAVAMACRSSMLFPVARAPERIMEPVFFAAAASSIFLARVTVSSRTSMLGDRNRSHDWLFLNASTTLNWSITGPGIATTLPTIAASTIVSGLSSWRPLTSSALVLLSTIRFRIAFLSPGAGGRPVFTGAFFLTLNDRAAPFAFMLGAGFAFGFTAARAATVEKAASPCALERAYGDDEVEGLIRHFQQFVEAIANAWIGELWWVDWGSKVGVSRCFGCSTLLKKDAKMRPLKSCGILARATVNSLARTFCADNDTHLRIYSTQRYSKWLKFKNA